MAGTIRIYRLKSPYVVKKYDNEIKSVTIFVIAFYTSQKFTKKNDDIFQCMITLQLVHDRYTAKCYHTIHILHFHAEVPLLSVSPLSQQLAQVLLLRGHST